MRTALIILGYMKWHYGKAICSLTRIWGNFLYFVSEFFSLRSLFRNFFDPWKRMTDPYPKSFNLKKYFYAFITNLLMRIVGVIMRAFLLVIGLAAYLLLALLYPVAVAGWLVLPFFVLALFIMGLFLIIK